MPYQAASGTSRVYDAVRYGIQMELRKRMVPEADVPQRFRDLVRALERAEREQKA
jgi:hypothetical protein